MGAVKILCALEENVPPNILLIEQRDEGKFGHHSPQISENQAGNPGPFFFRFLSESQGQVSLGDSPVLPVDRKEQLPQPFQKPDPRFQRNKVDGRKKAPLDE